MPSQLRYRGLSYDPLSHEQLSADPVEHTYRGLHYSSPPRHLAAPVNSQSELRYRGIAYHHLPTNG
jgi:hypothetical protein